MRFFLSILIISAIFFVESDYLCDFLSSLIIGTKFLSSLMICANFFVESDYLCNFLSSLIICVKFLSSLFTSISAKYLWRVIIFATFYVDSLFHY